MRILRDISRESGIPYNTLRNWLYSEKKITEIGNTGKISNQTKQTEDDLICHEDVSTRLNFWASEYIDPSGKTNKTHERAKDFLSR